MIWLIGTLGAAVAAEPPARPPASERRPDDRLDTAQLEAEKNTLQWQLDYLQTALDHERKPVPLNERPGFWLGVGTAAGLGLTLGSAWAVGQIVPPTP
jgi:hypothetical protein